MKFLLVLFALAIQVSFGYKILIYVPGLSNSQAIFNYRLGELLAEHGHDVLMYRPLMHPEATKGTPKKTREMRFQSLKHPLQFGEMHKKMQGSFYNSTSALQFDWKELQLFQALLRESCEMQISDEIRLKKLKNEKFDLAIGHMYDFCPLGLFQVLEIPTYIWMSSGVMIDYMANYLGCPSPPSYVPNVMSSYSDRMTRLQRLQNTLGQIGLNLFFEYMVNRPFTELFRSHFGEAFPSMDNLASHSPLVFINSEEFLDFPRPILHKIVYIGGIKMNTPNALDKKWQTIMDNSVLGVVLLSFGSVVDGDSMPHSWKTIFLETFAKFPDYTFIWKYESELAEAKKYKNVILSPWVPQTDLFAHQKMRAFITHGGYNSLLEAATLGVPMVTMPLMGDQPANMRKGVRHGISVGIDKTNFSVPLLTKAIDTILKNESYVLNVKKLSSMIHKKPVNSESLAVGWVEFLAEHQELPNLQVTSIELSWYEYLLLDIIFASLLSILIALYFSYRILGLYYWWCCQYKAPNTKNIKRD